MAGSEAREGATESEERDFLRTREGGWYDPAKEYSSLFEKRYDLQRQRRMFVEAEVGGKTPSIGYAYLTALVSQNYFNTIFTTNFDDLLNEAFYIYSNQRPIVCAHDSSIHSITVTSKRPKIIKLHGDYLFDDLKSTLRETESLEQNMRAKFTEFSKEYGLIVVGYSGGDRSIMDTISTLLKNDMFLKGGIYWCIRKGSEVPDELRKLIWKDRVYFVEIEGFDEIFAEIYSSLNKGDVLPSSVISATHKPADVASRLLSNKDAFSSNCKYLVEAKKRLERVSKRTAIANFLAKPDDDGRVIANQDLGDDDLLILTEIENFIHQTHYGEAISKIRSALNDGVRLAMRLKLLRLQVTAHRLSDERKQALSIADEIISLQPKRGAHRLLKASLLNNIDEKIACIEEAIEIDSFYVPSHTERATYLAESARECYGEQRKAIVQKIYESLEIATTLDPRWSNTAWTQLFKTLNTHEFDKKKRLEKQKEIIEKLQKQNPFTLRVLGMEEELLETKDRQEKFDDFYSKITEGQSRANEYLVGRFDILRIKALLKQENFSAAKDDLDRGINNLDYREDSYLCLQFSKILRQEFAKDDLAIELLQSSLENEFDGDVFTGLISALCDLKSFSKVDELCEKWLHKLDFEWKSQIKQDVLEAKGLYADALIEATERARQTGTPVNEHTIFIHLKMGKFLEAEQLARTLLTPINYSPEAVEMLINLELARKRQNKSIDTKRLEAAVNVKPTPEVQSAAAALLSRRTEMLSALKQSMTVDKTFRFRAQDWPIFDEYREQDDFCSALKIKSDISFKSSAFK